MSSNFAYLHLHTHFSRGGGPGSPGDWCRRAAELGYSSVGISDRAPMAGFPVFHSASNRAGLSAIYGAELDLLLPAGGARNSAPVSQPVVLFARDQDGMANLAKLSTLACAGWPGSEAPIEWKTLAAHSGGLLLVLLGGDEAGALSPFVSANGKMLAEWGSLIGNSFAETAFAGLPHSGRPGDNALAEQVAAAAKGMGLPLLAMPTARYLHAEDAPAYEALRLARERAGWASTPTSSTAPDRPGPYYLRPPEEAAALFEQWPSSVENVARVVETCGGVGIGDWGLGVGVARSSGGEVSALGQLASRRLASLLGVDELPEDAQARLDAEIGVVDRNGDEGAWLALAHISKETSTGTDQIPLGAPLGMADGSLLAYALGLSPINPMPYARPSWLDCPTHKPPLPGVEVPATRRDALVSALISEYGPGRVAYAACVAGVTPIQAVQAAASILGIAGEPLKELLEAASKQGWPAPDTQHPTPTTIAASLRGAPIAFMPDFDTLLVAPRQLYGDLTLSSGAPLLSYQREGPAGWVPWPEETLCNLDYPALSLRSTSALSALDAALSLAAHYPSPTFNPAETDLSAYPPITDELATVIKKAELTALPYLSSKPLKGWKGEITAESATALVARSLNPDPQSLASNLRTEGTDGAILYKDQFASIIETSAGLSPGDASALRLAMLNPQVEGAEEARARFMSGCLASGLEQKEADALWDTLALAAPGLVSRYAAASWARIALWSAALKAGHPAALLAGAISSAWNRAGPAQVRPIAEEARRLGVRLLPPDMNHSHAGLSLARDGAGWAILWGLALLPGWGKDEAEKFIRLRPRQGFAALHEVASAVVDAGLSQTQLETLVQAGGCDHFARHERGRAALLDALPALMEWAVSSHLDVSSRNLFSTSQQGSDPKPLPQPDEDTPLSPRERHVRRSWEEQNLGIGFTPATEMDSLRQALDKTGGLRTRLMTSVQAHAAEVGQSVYLVGLLCSVRLLNDPQYETGHEIGRTDGHLNGQNRQGPTPLAIARVEDLDGEIELVAFPPNYKRHHDLWVENNLVIVTGRASKHPDGAVYLLCEHLAAYRTAGEEEALEVVIKAPAAHYQRAPARNAPRTSPPEPAPEPDVAAAPASIGSARVGSMGSQHLVDSVPLTAQPPASPTYKLIVTLPSAGDDHAAIDAMIALNKLLKTHPGPDSVTLRIPYSPQTGDVTTAQFPHGVRYTPDLEAGVRDILGPDALAVIKLIG